MLSSERPHQLWLRRPTVVDGTIDRLNIMMNDEDFTFASKEKGEEEEACRCSISATFDLSREDLQVSQQKRMRETIRFPRLVLQQQVANCFAAN